MSIAVPAVPGSRVVSGVDRSVVPAGLDFDPERDPQRRRHLILAMPWGATVDARHDDEWAGRTLRRGDAQVDRGLARAGFVNVNHDVRQKVGTIVDAVEDERGIWAVVDLTEEGERVFAAGNGDVSAEIIQPGAAWLLAGVALLSAGESPAIPGSRIMFSRKQYRTYVVEPVSLQLGVGLVQNLARQAFRNASGTADLRIPSMNPGSPGEAAWWPEPSPATRVAVDITGHVTEMAGWSISAAHAQIERDRQLYADRLASLAELEAERPETERNAWGVPAMLRPPDSPVRQSYDAWERQATRKFNSDVRRARIAELRASIARRTADREAAVMAAREDQTWTQRLSRFLARCLRTARSGLRRRPATP